MPSKWARKDWQLQQEDNLQYVAVTRAKSTLVEVSVTEGDNLG
jgi:superfamily I DNA/RNA helicase